MNKINLRKYPILPDEPIEFLHNGDIVHALLCEQNITETFTVVCKKIVNIVYWRLENTFHTIVGSDYNFDRGICNCMQKDGYLKLHRSYFTYFRPKIIILEKLMRST